MTSPDLKKIDDKSMFSATVNYFSILTIANVEVPAESVLNLHVYEWAFDILPRIDIVINDNGAFNEKYPVVDNTPIQLEYAINEEMENTVVLDFLAQSISIENSNTGENTNSIVRIVGVLKNNNMLFPLVSKAFEEKPSHKVIEDIAKDTGFTPDIRIQTPDTMTWLQPHMTNSEMIKDVLDRAYVADDDAVFCYVNRNSDMVYTSIQTEADKPDNFMAMYSEMATIPVDHAEVLLENEDGRELILYNNLDYKSIAPIINKDIYYGANTSYYDGNDNVSINIDSDIHSLSKYSHKDKSYAGQIVNHNVYGIDNNVHQNYFRSLTENKYIKQGFFSSPMMMSCKPNNNLNLFDKIDLLIDAQDGISTNDVMSGKYLVGGIIHHFTKDGTYGTLVCLFRNGLEEPTFDKDLELNLTS